MAKFRYIGDHQRGDCLGYKFQRNISTEVVNPVHIKKLEGNPHFRRMDVKQPAPTPPLPPQKESEPLPPEGEGETEPDSDQTTTEENGEAGDDGDEGTDQVAGAE